jgi:uncharacterized protein (TIGR03545 family)
MAKKLPKIFRKEYSQENFNKKILKKIYLNEYKEFLQKTTSKTAAGTIAVKPELNKKEYAQLKKIAKSVKKNSGFVLKGRLTLLFIIFTGVIVFNVFFKDMLIEMAAEAGLQAVFNAKVDIQGLHFRILAGRLSLTHMEVANSNKPMRNLFELGETALDVDLFELLKGKVILEDIKCLNIKWDTERKTSGALRPAGPTPSQQEEKKAEEQKKEEGGLFDFNITEEDVKKLIDEQKQNLASLKLVGEYGESYAKLTTSWQDSLKQSDKKIENLSQSVNKINEIKINKIKTAADAQSAYSAIKTALSDLDKVKKEFDQSAKSFSSDLSRMNKDREKLFNTINADYKNITALLPLPSQEKGGVVSLIAQNILGQYLGELYTYVNQARSYADMLKPTSEQEVKEKKPERFKGMDIQYPSFVKPKFWLKNMSFSVVDDRSFGTISGELLDLTSQPDLIDKPMIFNLTQTLKQESVALNGRIDLRKNPPQLMALKLNLKNFPYQMEKGLEFLSISKMKCQYSLEVAFSLDKSNYSSGSLKVTLTDLDITYSEDNLVSRGLRKAVATLPFITIGAGYSIDQDGKLALKITENNIDALIQALISSLIQELTAQTKELVQKEIDKLLESDLKQYKEYYQGMTALAKDWEQNRLTLDNYKKILDGKKKEAEKKIQEGEKGLFKDIEKIF